MSWELKDFPLMRILALIRNVKPTVFANHDAIRVRELIRYGPERRTLPGSILLDLAWWIRSSHVERIVRVNRDAHGRRHSVGDRP